MRRLSDREIECLIELWHVEDWRRRAFTHVNGRWSAVTDVDVRPLGALTSVNVHSVNRPLYKCRRSCATAYSWRPVGQPRRRRHSHLCRFRVVADRHCWSANNVWHHLCTCPCRSALHLCIVSYRIISRYLVWYRSYRIVSLTAVSCQH